MKKAKYVMDSSGRDHSALPLSQLEGTVDFSESGVTDGDWPNLTLSIKNDKRKIWIRREHRINVGEKVRLHYGSGSSPVIAEAYEILTPNGKQVSYRYHSKGFKFVDA